MNERPGSDDDRLLDQLRALSERYDAVPERVLEAARGSLTWRTIDAELAALAHDSAVDADAALVREQGASRLVSFEAAELTIELEVREDGERRHVLGQLVPPRPAAVELRSPAGGRETDADELGRFALHDLARGPARIRVTAAGAVVETDWITL